MKLKTIASIATLASQALKMNGIIAVAALLAAETAFGAIRAATPTVWNGKPDSWQMRRHAEKMQQAAAGGVKVVFIGDSITNGWEQRGRGPEQLKKYFSEGDWKMLNLGYSADRTEHVLWRLDNGELDGYKAKCVMVMIGTNNAYPRNDPKDVVKGIRRILDVISEKQPQAKILLLPIFVRGEGPQNVQRKANEEVNAAIKSFADGEKVIWVDFNAKYLDAKGDTKWIMPDRVHPNADGYKIWTDVVLPHFKRFCDENTPATL